MDYILVKRVSAVLRSINHKTRQDIISNIRKTPNINITKLSSIMRIDVSILSQHLAILRQSKIIAYTRNGKYIEYLVNEQYLLYIEKVMFDFISKSEQIKFNESI
jgi:DNA-binding transcriptional ArsR family regulator